MTNYDFEEIRKSLSADKQKEFDIAIQNLNKQIDQIIQELKDRNS